MFNEEERPKDRLTEEVNANNGGEGVRFITRELLLLLLLLLSESLARMSVLPVEEETAALGGDTNAAALPEMDHRLLNLLLVGVLLSSTKLPALSRLLVRRLDDCVV